MKRSDRGQSATCESRGRSPSLELRSATFHQLEDELGYSMSQLPAEVEWRGSLSLFSAVSFFF